MLYLHGTTRCETCLEIERIAEETVRTSFAEALTAGTLSWQSVDYDLPENARYDTAFVLSCPSLVLARISTDGQFGRHAILGQTWDLVPKGGNALAEYIRREIAVFLPSGTATGEVEKEAAR